MQLSGLLHGAKLLRFVNFPVPEVLGPEASEAEIKAMLDRHGMVFIKPIFKGAIGKKGKAGLVGKARDLRTALAERERLRGATSLRAVPKTQAMICRSNRAPVMNSTASRVIVRDMPVLPS
jgi:hypothetical protein